MNDKDKKIYLPTLIGEGYKEFWNFKGRYRVVKGSRGSKKSKTTALYYIYSLMKYKDANLLVVRKTFRTLKDSCFTELVWAINQLQVSAFFKITTSPLEIVYLPTNQKIYFRGLDDPLKVTSITVTNGVLCWLWIEEAYEISKLEDFEMLNESIRGVVLEPLFKQVTITFNPWSEHHWLKKKFFDTKDDDTLAITTTYKCNEWLDKADLKLFENMKVNNPRRYQVAGLGHWGIVDGLVYENWHELDFNINEIRKRVTVKSAFGLDFGYTNDPTALFCGLVDITNKQIYVFDEVYEKGLVNQEIYNNISKKNYQKEKIIADSAEPKSIQELRNFGLYKIQRSKKGKDSINHGIDTIQSFKIFIHPSCINFLAEISSYTWQIDKNGRTINKPIDDNNHLMDAMRYALEFIKSDIFSFD